MVGPPPHPICGENFEMQGLTNAISIVFKRYFPPERQSQSQSRALPVPARVTEAQILL